MVGRLTEAGFLERVEGRIAPTRKFFSYPVIGRVRAGVPQPASQESFEALNIEDVLVRVPSRTRSLQAVSGMESSSDLAPEKWSS